MGRPSTSGITAAFGTKEYHRQFYALNREKYSAASNERQLRKTLDRLGISREEYDHLCQLGCAICGVLDSGKRRLHIDHDHDTGKFRGMLCGNCNSAIGLLGDDIENIGDSRMPHSHYASVLHCRGICQRNAQFLGPISRRPRIFLAHNPTTSRCECQTSLPIIDLLGNKFRSAKAAAIPRAAATGCDASKRPWCARAYRLPG